MEMVQRCDERTIKGIEQMLRRCALGRPVAFSLEGGAESRGMTFRLDIAGGYVKHEPLWLRLLRAWRGPA